MSVGKIKSAMTQVTTAKGIPKVLITLAIGFIFGVIADFIMEALVWATAPEKGWGCLEIGFSFYYKKPDITCISYDDLILLGVTIAAFFTRKLWLVLGFFLGWYISSNEMLYHAIAVPFGAPIQETSGA